MWHKSEKVEGVKESARKRGEDRYRTADWQVIGKNRSLKRGLEWKKMSNGQLTQLALWLVAAYAKLFQVVADGFLSSSMIW